MGRGQSSVSGCSEWARQVVVVVIYLTIEYIARVLVHLLDQPGLPLNTQRRDGASPLWIAAQMGHEDCVRLLLRAGAKVDLARADGATPLFKACHKVNYQLFMQLLVIFADMSPLSFLQASNNHP